MNFKNKTVTIGILATILTGTSMVQYMPIAYAKSVNTVNGTANLGQGNAQITIIGNEGQSLVGKKFEVFQLFYAENAASGESINYTFNPVYAPALRELVGNRLNISANSVHEYQVIDYIQTLNHHQVEGAFTNQTLEGRYSDYRYFVEDLRDIIKRQGITGDIITVNDTRVNGSGEESFVIGGLDYAYYLVDEITDNPNTHQAASLIMTNTANPEALIHIKSDYPSLIKKIHEDDNNVGWNDIADYEIGQTVPYKYESTIPNMNGYHVYYYAWHDKMNEALTFDPASVNITISDDTKSYTLANTEFKVKDNLDSETFMIEIDDIKAIVDKQFPNMNADKENVYGQKVTLTYNASLNDKASLDTGRPGFENTVRLEFSNDADRNGNGETGYTPWDTVVCFTFKLNVSKINNYDKPLADAKFRLYSDEDCENEVFVKEADNGYIVINRDSIGGSDHTGGEQPSEAIEMVSDEDGLFTIIGLDSGTYYLKETDSPAGYRELEDPIILNVNATYTSNRNVYVQGDGATNKALKSFTSSAHIKEFLDLNWKEDDQILTTDIEDGAINLTVVNTVLKKLPITGVNSGLFALGIGAALVGATGVALSKKKKSHQK